MNNRLGYIGLGIMGRPMATHLIQAGYPMSVWARRPESLAPLVAIGANPCDSAAEVARHSDIVFINVSDTSDVEQVVLGDRGVIEGANPGSVVIDNSTISPTVTRAIAEQLRQRDIEMLDAPVSGGEQGAVAATLSIMVGGRAEVFERALPFLKLLGKNIVHVGRNGAGQVAKTCNQVVVAMTIAAVGEAMVVAEASGVDPAKVREALLGGFAYSKILEVHGQRMLDNNFAPGFKARLHRKDMGIALQTAADLGVALPGAALAAQLINALVGHGGGELDSSAIVKMQRLLGSIETTS
ncbi:MAG: 2-hydroxy-3-oxopropionate reductase [Thiotrichales bacterium]